MSAKTDLSIVIPLCNEAATLSPLYDKIAATMGANTLGSFEVIFVDDGSTDESWATLEALKASHPKTIKALRFRRNHGKAAALSAGFATAAGNIILTMDADLQDEPAEIPNFLAKLHEGYDCVSGWKQLRQDPLGKTLPSRVFNAATRATQGVDSLFDVGRGH
jgi:glycosyltransferase involved in cell wall biosynthesis